MNFSWIGIMCISWTKEWIMEYNDYENLDIKSNLEANISYT